MKLARAAVFALAALVAASGAGLADALERAFTGDKDEL